ncbi:hypothetical protein D9758_006456 [Tetrapyrgos nigripes]|uniref:Amino acid transporter n=1 Tax=Tetrapyrgos nigripes TaxID=182062 RepID=A0A8H5GKI7_9AGAR|nr:hypothetical protein D9758_006456 [Tetrapyrgos nigripes]
MDTKLEETNVDLLAEQDLHKLGYQQAMTRTRGLPHILFMTLAIMAVPFGLAAPFATGLVGGGPVTTFWGWVLVSFFTMFTALSLAEISAKYPTSGGAYYWCFRLAKTRETGLLASWICGWFIMVGVWTICLSVTFGTGQLLVAGIGMFKTDWNPEAWQTYLIFLAVLFFSTAIGIFCNKILPLIDILSAYFTIIGTLVIFICVSAKAATGRRSASFALGDFDPESGWTPGWSFFIGLLPVCFLPVMAFGRHSLAAIDPYYSVYHLAYTYSAIGMITNMAEEVHNPTVQLPRALVWSIPIGFIEGVFFLLPILFTLPDIATLLAVPTGQPIALMFELIMGNKAGGFGLWFIIFVIGLFCAISICCAASRATWAFARDKALPFHAFFSQINPDSDVPIPAYFLTTVIQLLLGLIYLGSSAAFNAFVGVAVICLGASYAIPIGMSLYGRRKNVEDSPYSLGRWGWWINAVAVLWILFEIVLFSMPAIIPVTPSTMNYASVVFVGFAVISGVWYVINGRFNYSGPPLPQEDLATSGSSPTSSVEAEPKDLKRSE